MIYNPSYIIGLHRTIEIKDIIAVTISTAAEVVKEFVIHLSSTNEWCDLRYESNQQETYKYPQSSYIAS